MLQQNTGNISELQEAFPELVECVLVEANLLNLPSELWSELNRDVIMKIQTIITDEQLAIEDVAAILREVAESIEHFTNLNLFYIYPDEIAHTWKMANMNNYRNHDSYIFMDSHLDFFWDSY